MPAVFLLQIFEFIYGFFKKLTNIGGKFSGKFVAKTIVFANS